MSKLENMRGIEIAPFRAVCSGPPTANPARASARPAAASRASVPITANRLCPSIPDPSSPWSASSYAHGAPGVKKPPLSVRKAAAICFFMIPAFRSERRQRLPPAPPCFASAPRPHASAAAGRLHQNPHIPLRRQAPSPTGILHLQRSIPG